MDSQGNSKSRLHDNMANISQMKHIEEIKHFPVNSVYQTLTSETREGRTRLGSGPVGHGQPTLEPLSPILT